MLVIGGGYIGLELGQGLARLGSQTHLIVRGDRVLDHEESEVSEVLAAAFQQDGIGLHFGVTVCRTKALRLLKYGNQLVYLEAYGEIFLLKRVAHRVTPEMLDAKRNKCLWRVPLYRLDAFLGRPLLQQHV